MMCDKCGHRMYRDRRKNKIITNFLAEIVDGEEISHVRLTMFRDILVQLCRLSNTEGVGVFR